MLEAYFKNQTLRELEAQVPANAAQVKQKLVGFLEEDGFNANALFMLAHCHNVCDEPNEAKEALRNLLVAEPEHIQAKIELAKICLQENDSRAATELLRDVTSARPEIVEAWRLLSEALQRDSQEAASKDALRQYDMIRAFNKKFAVAEQAYAKADFQAADLICRELLQLVPSEMRTLRLLARLARRFGHYEFSTDTLGQCVEARPRDAALRFEYAQSLLGSRKHRAALEQCQALIELMPETLEAYNLKAEILFNLGRYDEAIEIYRELSRVPSSQAITLLHMGKVLKTIGQIAEATACFQQAIDIDAALAQVYWELADLKTYRFTDSEITSMKALLNDAATPNLNKVLAGFALGKAFEDAAQFAESFQYYQAANRTYANILRRSYSSPNEALRSFFTKEYFASRKESGDDSDAPIFVLGLPRSGSTLVEQILSSHSQIDATQELDEIVSIVREFNYSNQPEQERYPYSLGKLGSQQIQELARRYLEYAQDYRQHAPHFIDKAPGNFQHIGLIKTLFPNARIIDIRRNPMASGWSQYRQFFANSFQFSYDLETIGKYYNDYLDLMNHWHAVLPGQILTVQYENLVNDLDATVESILKYCGLEPEDACLDFHLNKRAVATPSSEQVRQPLYTNALEHWKNYESFLEPLRRTVENSDLAAES